MVKNKYYFDEKVEQAIVEYKHSNDQKEKNKLYRETIDPAFDKLIENIINIFRLEYFEHSYEDIKAETKSMFIMNLNKFDETRGTKAFSYFMVTGKRFLWNLNNDNFASMSKTCSVNVVDMIDNLMIVPEDHRDNRYYRDFIDEFVIYLKDIIPEAFYRELDINIANAIVELLKNVDKIDNYRKKGLYIIIREMCSDVHPNYITRVITTIKYYYDLALKRFEKTGTIFN